MSFVLHTSSADQRSSECCTKTASHCYNRDVKPASTDLWKMMCESWRDWCIYTFSTSGRSESQSTSRESHSRDALTLELRAAQHVWSVRHSKQHAEWGCISLIFYVLLSISGSNQKSKKKWSGIKAVRSRAETFSRAGTEGRILFARGTMKRLPEGTHWKWSVGG